MKLLVLVAVSAAFVCAQAPMNLPINPLPPDTVIAVSDGKPITAGEIRKLLESGDPKMIELATQSPEQFLSNVVFLRYLSEEGKKIHIQDESPWKEQIQVMTDRIIFTAMVNRVREEYAVPEKDIADFYNKNQSRYEQAWIKVIAIGFCPTVSTTPGTSDEAIRAAAQTAVQAAHCTSKRTEAQGLEKAQGLVGELRAGADFVKFVAQYSEDPDSKATQGDFGLVTRDNAIPQEIKNAVFSLNNADVSDPIKSGNFFYVIKIKEKTVQPLANVREPILQQLKQQHFTDWLTDVNKRFKPVIERNDFFINPNAPKQENAPQLIPKP